MESSASPEVPPFLVTLDRVEEGIAVLVSDDGQRLLVRAALLPPDIREGHVMSLRLEPEPEETSARLERASDLRRRLLERSEGS